MKRISVLVVVLMMVGSGILCVRPCLAAAQEPIHFAVQRLQGLDVIEENYNSNGVMSRGEFARVIARLFQQYSVDYSAEQYFSDVGEDMDQEMVQAVNLLAVCGIVKGNGDVEFAPEEPITFEAAAAILVRLLGYEIDAEENGGFPVGYIRASARLGLTAGTSEAEFSNGTLALMVSNALDASMLVQRVWGERFQLQVDENSTLLNTLMKIRSFRGRLQAVGEVALSTEYQVQEGCVLVDGKSFLYEHSAALKLLGRKVDVYYSDAHGVNRAVFVQPVEEGEVLILPLEESTMIDLANNEIRYTGENGKTAYAKLLQTPYMVHNGRPIQTLPQLGSNGTITCVKGDSGQYESLIIRDFETHVLQNIYEEGNKLQSKYAHTPLPALREIEEYKLFDAEGNSLEPASLHADDVLSVLRSLDGEYVEMYRTRKSIYGRIDGVQGEGEEDYRLIISAISYSTTPEFYEYLQSRATSSLLGLTTNFYIDNFGNVAGFADETIQRQSVGYLTAVRARGMMDQPRIRVFSDKGIFEEFELRQDMTYNQMGKTVEGMAACDWFVKKFIGPQLIAYRTDKNGAISKLITAAAEGGDGLYEMLSLPAVKRYRSGQKTFASKAMLKEDTVVFTIPKSSGDVDSEEYYKVSGIENFENNTEYSDLTFYTFRDGALTADVVVHRRNFDGILSNVCPYLVEDIVQAVNGNGAVTERVIAWNNGAQTFFDAKEDFVLSTAVKRFKNISCDPIPVATGDIVRLSKNSVNEACGTEMIYSYGTDTYYPTSNPYINDNNEGYRFGMGKVTAHDGTMIRLQYRDTGEVDYFNIASAKVLVVEKRGNTPVLREGDAADVTMDDQSDVFVYSPSNNPSVIYVFHR